MPSLGSARQLQIGHFFAPVASLFPAFAAVDRNQVDAKLIPFRNTTTMGKVLLQEKELDLTIHTSTPFWGDDSPFIVVGVIGVDSFIVLGQPGVDFSDLNGKTAAIFRCKPINDSSTVLIGVRMQKALADWATRRQPGLTTFCGEPGEKHEKGLSMLSSGLSKQRFDLFSAGKFDIVPLSTLVALRVQSQMPEAIVLARPEADPKAADGIFRPPLLLYASSKRWENDTMLREDTARFMCGIRKTAGWLHSEEKAAVEWISKKLKIKDMDLVRKIYKVTEAYAWPTEGTLTDEAIRAAIQMNSNLDVEHLKLHTDFSAVHQPCS